MPKMSRQKFKCLENEKSSYDEIKSIFHNFWRASIEANKKIFLKGESATLSILGDSWNFIPLILVQSSVKYIATQILVIAKLNGNSQQRITCSKIATDEKGVKTV